MEPSMFISAKRLSMKPECYMNMPHSFTDFTANGANSFSVNILFLHFLLLLLFLHSHLNVICNIPLTRLVLSLFR